MQRYRLTTQGLVKAPLPQEKASLEEPGRNLPTKHSPTVPELGEQSRAVTATGPIASLLMRQ